MPFNFQADLEDHCETPSSAYKDVACLLRALAQRLHPGVHWREAAAKLEVYDPYYCQGGSKRRLGRLGFDKVFNENVDFYKAIRENTVPPFDVLVTNPPFSTREHTSAALGFAISSGKPWLMVYPVYGLFSDNFIEASAEAAKSGSEPFFVVPPKKYNFKTPAPLPPPPKENRQRAAPTRHCMPSSLRWPGRRLPSRDAK